MFPLFSGAYGAYEAPAWPVVPWAHPASAKTTKSAASCDTLRGSIAMFDMLLAECANSSETARGG
jgi:hypothetical protein